MLNRSVKVEYNQFNLHIHRFKLILRPKLFLASLFHLTLALGTGMPIPHSDFVAAALQTEPPHFAPIGRCHIGNNPTHHDVLDALAVGTRHGTYLLAEESSAFVHLGFVATFLTAIFEFPSHFFTENRFCWGKNT